MRTIVIAALALAGCETCPDRAGVACVYAGTGQLARGADNLPPTRTAFYWTMDMEFAPDGTAYLIDWNNHVIRRMTPKGVLETVVGNLVGDGPRDMSDLTEPGAPGREVNLNHPTDMQFDASGRMILAAWHNHKIRSWDPRTGLVLVLSGRGPGFDGDGGPFEDALFSQPPRIVLTPDGGLYILDQRNQRIRYVTPGGEITTVVGTGVAGYSGDGGPPAEAELNFETGPNPEPSGGIAVDADGNLYVADGLSHRIRRVDFAADRIETVVGTGVPGFAGDGGPGAEAQVNHVRDLEIGPDGRLYFADTENDRIRAWDPTTDVVVTVAGSGERGNGVPGLDALEIELDRPMGVAFGPDGALYVADTFNSRYLRIGR